MKNSNDKSNKDSIPEDARERYVWYLQTLADTRQEVIELCKERIERLEQDLKNQQNWQYINYN